MARKTKAVQITAEGRDKGKTFWITEMDALRAEKWAARALLAFAKSGRSDMPEDLQAGGAAALVRVGLIALTGLDFEDAEPLMDEMLGCIQYVPDASKVDQFTKLPITRPVTWDGDAADIDEPMTIVFLRNEVIELHLGFSIAAWLSNLGEKAKAALSNSSGTSTSPNQSETSPAPV